MSWEFGSFAENFPDYGFVQQVVGQIHWPNYGADEFVQQAVAQVP